MIVYSLVWYNHGILDYSVKDTIEEMNKAHLFQNLEDAKKAAEDDAREQYQKYLKDCDLEDGEEPDLDEPNLTWQQLPNVHGKYQLDPWEQMGGHVSDWTPGWWAIHELKVH